MDKIKFDFNNRTAVITGGAQGFGLDIARRFLKFSLKYSPSSALIPKPSLQ